MASEPARVAAIESMVIVFIASFENGWRTCSCAPCEQARRSYRKHGQKHEMAAQNAPSGIDAKADRLRDAEHHGAEECAPCGAHAADDHGLESEDQLGRTIRWRDGGA